MGWQTAQTNTTGSTCSGSDGDLNRVLTLSNTGLTRQSDLLIYASGLALTVSNEYIVSHNTTSTQITFLNRLWDDMTILVSYSQNISGLANDFELGPLNDFGVSVTRTPVTMVPHNITGQKTYTDGSDESITVVFTNPKKSYPLDKSGLTETADALMFVKTTQTINKYDKITYNSKIYRVDTVDLRKFNGTSMFQRVTLFFVE